MARKNKDNSTSAKGNYELVPAGLFSLAHGGLGLWVRYVKNPNRILVKEISPRHIIIQCPDRDLCLVSNIHHANGFRPMSGNWDKFVNLSLFHDVNSADLDMPYFMVNYTQAVGKEDKTANNRLNDTRNFEDKHTKIISDSGGFQILAGRTDYLDPLKIVEWYNSNVDIGLVLDIPTFTDTKGLFDRLAKIQKANTRVMLENKRESLELMNIFHGHTPEEVQRFRSIVEEDEINRLAIGASYFDTMMSSLGKVATLMQTGRKYEHYHMLGVANIKQVYPLMLMAKNGFAKEITSDASTWLQESTSKGYYHQEHIAEPPGFIKMFDKVNSPSPYNTLPCNCAVCENIKYTDVLSVLNGNVTTFILAHHNMFAYNALCKAMKGIIAEASLGDVKDLVRRQFRTRSGKEEAIKCLDFVDEIARNGIDHAYRKFSLYLKTMKTNLDSSTTLFGDVVNPSEAEEREAEEANAKGNRERTLRLCEIYEGNLTAKHGKVNKTKDSKGHMKASSSAKKRKTKVKPAKKVKGNGKDTKSS